MCFSRSSRSAFARHPFFMSSFSNSLIPQNEHSQFIMTSISDSPVHRSRFTHSLFLIHPASVSDSPVHHDQCSQFTCSSELASLIHPFIRTSVPNSPFHHAEHDGTDLHLTSLVVQCDLISALIYMCEITRYLLY